MISISRMVVAAVALMVAACAPVVGAPVRSTAAPVVTAATFVGTWNLDQVDDKAVQPRRVTVQFGADGTYVAQVTCRDIIGGYTFIHGKLTVGPLRTTHKGCLTPLAHEELITNALMGGPWTVRLDGPDALRLDGRNRLSLSRVRN